MKRWTYDHGNATVVQVECTERGYPNKDERGDTQYENTHFDTEAEAWAKLLSEAKAGVSLSERARVRARKLLEDATEELANDAEILARATRAFEARQRECAESTESNGTNGAGGNG